jgi:hypothetical protein
MEYALVGNMDSVYSLQGEEAMAFQSNDIDIV